MKNKKRQGISIFSTVVSRKIKRKRLIKDLIFISICGVLVAVAILVAYT